MKKPCTRFESLRRGHKEDNDPQNEEHAPHTSGSEPETHSSMENEQNSSQSTDYAHRTWKTKKAHLKPTPTPSYYVENEKNLLQPFMTESHTLYVENEENSPTTSVTGPPYVENEENSHRPSVAGPRIPLQLQNVLQDEFYVLQSPDPEDQKDLKQIQQDR
ncbi:hypothetical protein ILUMI_04396 [Ignelater luminosus]|uniref:Uncharacterized protein n=1 Tax=Ignelater luminosus TaxID=2038154 RepID=A0A8K0D925_IGNLU|nr:hypothetical protein ILUMI_04396 [Ignelater luminosus]